VSGVSLHILLKAPRPGLVKTRLAASLGPALALNAYRAMVANVLAAADASALPSRIHFAPAGEQAAVAGLVGPGRRLTPQAPGDLGSRMAAALEAAFAAGDEAAVLMGSDLPLVTAGHLLAAASALATHPAVLGPAADGGYWLIGFTRQGFWPEVFTAMPWSRPAVAGLPRARRAAAGRPAALLPELSDCDEAADLKRLAAPPFREALAGTPFGRFLEQAPAGLFDQNPGCR
jgi:rSAM/selenodomain-associated transferase 1